MQIAICRVPYTEFKVRFCNHKSSMLKSKTKKTCELAVHFNCIKHEISQISFIVIEQITSQGDGVYLDQLLLTREAYWTAQLFTLNPHGLNKRCDFRSKNRICYNPYLAYHATLSNFSTFVTIVIFSMFFTSLLVMQFSLLLIVFYYMDRSVLLKTKILIESISHYT